MQGARVCGLGVLAPFGVSGRVPGAGWLMACCAMHMHMPWRGVACCGVVWHGYVCMCLCVCERQVVVVMACAWERPGIIPDRMGRRASGSGLCFSFLFL